jgi:hypothetical protein
VGMEHEFVDGSKFRAMVAHKYTISIRYIAPGLAADPCGRLLDANIMLSLHLLYTTRIVKSDICCQVISFMLCGGEGGVWQCVL